MSIAVNIYYRGTKGNARKFAEEMESSGTADAIRREEGNIKYDYFFPMADPETVLLIDCWENQNALDSEKSMICIWKWNGMCLIEMKCRNRTDSLYGSRTVLRVNIYWYLCWRIDTNKGGSEKKGG